MLKGSAGIVLVGVLCASPALAGPVRGYTSSRGAYVQPHYRSTPDTTRFNNYSVKPNVNPMTGSIGTKSPYVLPNLRGSRLSGH